MRTTRKGQAQPRAGAKSPADAPSAPNGKFSLISDEKLIGLYTNLLKCRTADRQFNGNSNGKSSPFVSREAALVGTAIDLGAGDLVCSLDRGLLAGLSDGTAIDKLLVDSANGRLFIAKNGVNGKGAAVPSFVHSAIGTALACKTSKNEKVAVIYSAGTDSDSLSEAIHVASVHGLPIIFVQCMEGDSGRPGANSKRDQRKKDSTEETPWFPCITVDTNDVVAVYRVANEAISRARLGRGPTVIECRPFLLDGKHQKRNGRHATDPVLKMENYLRAKGLFDPKLKGETTTK
jgi:pyruvate dehydrogenase E1 component alpha subunit